MGLLQTRLKNLNKSKIHIKMFLLIKVRCLFIRHDICKKVILLVAEIWTYPKFINIYVHIGNIDIVHYERDVSRW